jgi:starvation-inducible DNA-binding protein
MKNKHRSTKPPGAIPKVSHCGIQLQEFGTVIPMPNGLSKDVCTKSTAALNLILADTITLRDLYKKHHWQVAGPTFYGLHLMFDKHSES